MADYDRNVTESPIADAHEQTDRDAFFKPWSGQGMLVPRTPEQWEHDAIMVSARMLARAIDDLADVQGVTQHAVMLKLARLVGVPYSRIQAWTGSGIPDGKTREAIWKLIQQGLSEAWTGQENTDGEEDG